MLRTLLLESGKKVQETWVRQLQQRLSGNTGVFSLETFLSLYQVAWPYMYVYLSHLTHTKETYSGVDKEWIADTSRKQDDSLECTGLSILQTHCSPLWRVIRWGSENKKHTHADNILGSAVRAWDFRRDVSEPSGILNEHSLYRLLCIYCMIMLTSEVNDATRRLGHMIGIKTTTILWRSSVQHNVYSPRMNFL